MFGSSLSKCFPFLGVLFCRKLHLLQAPYCSNCRNFGYSSCTYGVLVVSQVLIIFEKNIVEMTYSVRSVIMARDLGKRVSHFTISR